MKNIWVFRLLPMLLKVKNGAIFIADAHENEQRRSFWHFLCEIEQGRISASQLFLMGDIFDLLVGEINATHSFANPYIDKLESLALNIDVFYFEGNHDFNLKKFFKHVKVFDTSSQPLVFDSKAGKILISHGDQFEHVLYRIYTFFIRNFFISTLLNMINKLFKGKISEKIISSQKNKNICRKIEDFEQKIALKLQRYELNDISYVFEGHYHQDKEFELKGVNYKNFSSFACDKSYFVVQSTSGIKFTQLKLRDSNGGRI